MKDEIILEHSERATDIHFYLDNSLRQVAETWEFTWKTPTHDLARRLMNHIMEFKQAELFEEGGH